MEYSLKSLSFFVSYKMDKVKDNFWSMYSVLITTYHFLISKNRLNATNASPLTPGNGWAPSIPYLKSDFKFNLNDL